MAAGFKRITGYTVVSEFQGGGLGEADFDDIFIKKSFFSESGLYVWGNNAVGVLGLNNTANRSNPVLVGASYGWLRAEPGGSSAIRRDGTLWTWGQNNNGQLGQNDLVHRSSPTQVGTDVDWYLVSATIGGFNMAAIKTNGTLWVWGNNDFGKLGQNDNNTSRSSPVQVGTGTNWKQVVAGIKHTLAIQTNGTLWGWGYNTRGGLGQNDTVHRSSPTQIGTDSNWKLVDCNVAQDEFTVAIKTDGTMWAWGDNTNGQLGQGDTIHRSSPVQIGTGTDWRVVSCGFNGYVHAVRGNGSLWSWGYNQIGQLGQSNTIHRSSPVQVGALTSWQYVNGRGDGVTVAIQRNGTLWSWGRNESGQLGTGEYGNAHRSSPQQIGSGYPPGALWRTAAATDYGVFAISQFE